MTQEDKKLLLKDLCGRLPYGVKVCYRISDKGNPITETLSGHMLDYFNENSIVEVKPYLRPLSSMTEDEYDEFKGLTPCGRWCDDYDRWAHWGVEVVAYEYDETNKPYYDFVDFQKLLDWLNSHHFDYRGLIEKGLALECITIKW